MFLLFKFPLKTSNTKFKIKNDVKIAKQIVIYKRMFKHVNSNINFLNY